MRAIRDNETSAAVSGVNLAITKTLSFGVASALGGVGGAIYVAEIGIASPDDFSSLVAIYLIVGLVVGGVGTPPWRCYRWSHLCACSRLGIFNPIYLLCSGTMAAGTYWLAYPRNLINCLNAFPSRRDSYGMEKTESDD